MQTDQDLFKQAVAAARAGREWTARDMFLRVVEINPQHEVAWMWLTGLLDDLDERIYACQQAVNLNPHNHNSKQYLERLLAKKQELLEEERRRLDEQFQAIRGAVKAGRRDVALLDLRDLIKNPRLDFPDAWRLLAQLSPELEERVRALEKLIELEPGNTRAQGELKQARAFLENPLHQAELYEECGDIERALMAYRQIAINTDSTSREWRRLYRKIGALENLRQERIAHVSPALHIARLTAGPPIVYFFFALLHLGVNPFARPEPVTWVGMLWVMAGGFLAALSSVKSHNRMWTWIFSDYSGSGSPLARRALSVAGWILILLPYLIMFISAWDHLLDQLY